GWVGRGPPRSCLPPGRGRGDTIVWRSHRRGAGRLSAADYPLGPWAARWPQSLTLGLRDGPAGVSRAGSKIVARLEDRSRRDRPGGAIAGDRPRSSLTSSRGSPRSLVSLVAAPPLPRTHGPDEWSQVVALRVDLEIHDGHPRPGPGRVLGRRLDPRI